MNTETHGSERPSLKYVFICDHPWFNSHFFPASANVNALLGSRIQW